MQVDGPFDVPEVAHPLKSLVPKSPAVSVVDRDTWGTSQQAQEGMRAMMALVGQPSEPMP